MKFFLLILFFFLGYFLFSQFPPTKYNSLVKKADSLYKIKEYRNSAFTFDSAFKTFGNKGYIGDRYRAARTWALSNYPDSAFACLEKITNNANFWEYEKTVNEEDFVSLHKDKRWNGLLKNIKLNDYLLVLYWKKHEKELVTYLIRAERDSIKNRNTTTIKSIKNATTKSHCDFINPIPAEEYLNKRVKISGYIKSKDVTGWTAFFVNITEQSQYKLLCHDYMENRRIKGTTDWKKFEIVLDVPNEAYNIIIGIALDGIGQIWLDELDLQIVDSSIPTTSIQDKK